MPILTPQEKDFLDVFLHEATTSPFFNGPATKALYDIGVEYRDISSIAWAYNREVPRRSYEWGRSAEMAPPLPWPSREAVLRRNAEIQRIWEQERKLAGSPKGPRAPTLSRSSTHSAFTPRVTAGGLRRHPSLVGAPCAHSCHLVRIGGLAFSL